MSAKFGDVVKQCLETPPEPDTEGLPERQKTVLESLWTDTLEWRTSCMDKARELSPGGLKRGEIMNAVGYHLGFPHDKKVDDWRDLMSFAESKGVLEPFIAFAKWVNECYHFNQAHEFGAYHNALQYDPVTSIVTRRMLGRNRSRERSFKQTKISIDLPPPLLLSHHPRPSDLLKVRSSPF